MSGDISRLLEKKGMGARQAKTTTIITRPTNLIQRNDIRETAVETVSNIIRSWEDEKSQVYQTLQSPAQYADKVHDYHSTYALLRATSDTGYVFIIGDLLSSCRERCFERNEESFSKWLQQNIKFLSRQSVYSYMSISKELSRFRYRKLSFKQLKAVLTVIRRGANLVNMEDELEKMGTDDILKLVPTEASSEKTVKIHLCISRILASLKKVNSEIDQVVHVKSEKGISGKQLSRISSLQDDVERIKARIDELLK